MICEKCGRKGAQSRMFCGEYLSTELAPYAKAIEVKVKSSVPLCLYCLEKAFKLILEDMRIRRDEYRKND